MRFLASIFLLLFIGCESGLSPVDQGGVYLYPGPYTSNTNRFVRVISEKVFVSSGQTVTICGEWKSAGTFSSVWVKMKVAGEERIYSEAAGDWDGSCESFAVSGDARTHFEVYVKSEAGTSTVRNIELRIE